MDESVTGSANPWSGPLPAALCSSVRPVHLPRSPAISPGTQALLWAVGLGCYIFLGMLAISISLGTSIVTSIVCAIVIFIAVRLFGEGAPPRPRRR